jgi:hypothetical protein
MGLQTRTTSFFFSSSIRLTAAVVLLFAALESQAQLPELASPSSLTGATTTARFFAGASADDGVSFKTSFGYSDPLDVSAEVRVESGHVNTTGNVYLIIALGNQYLVRDKNGGYQPWDLSLAKLLPTSTKTLQAREPITIVDSVAFGPAGLSGVSLAVFVAYDSAATPGQIFFSGAPLVFSIGQKPATVSSLTLFTNNISSRLIQDTCIVCHVANGTAATNSSTPSRLQYLTSNQANSLTINYNALVNFIKNVPDGSTLLLSKPLGDSGHLGGGVLSASSQDYVNLQAFVNAVKNE